MFSCYPGPPTFKQAPRSLCEHCTLEPKVIRYRVVLLPPKKRWNVTEYDALLTEAEVRGEKCLTTHADFKANMLSEVVLKIDIYRYLEDNWLLDNDDLGRMQKLYGLAACQRRLRWVFQIWSKKKLESSNSPQKKRDHQTRRNLCIRC